MNNIKIWLSGLALLAWSTQTMAQNEVDALRYSQLSFGGTARIQGIAGAQTALGADASTMAGNPAGLGLYRKGEFTFTPGFNFNETQSSLKGNTTEDSRNTFNISQLGIIFTDRKADDVVNNWRSGSFGIGFTRLNNFQMRTTYEGQVADENSLLQSFQDNIKAFNITQAELDAEYGSNADNITTLEGLAYANFLIEVDTLGNLFVPGREGAIRQNETIFSEGAQNQWDFSYGASYLDKLFIGGSLSLVSVRYEQQRTYTETAASDPFFSTMTLTDKFTTKGSGINFRIGAIYKPVDALRLGASIQTPTFTSLTDNYASSLTVDYKPGTFSNNQTHFFSTTIPGTYDYNLTTPFRANGGIAYFIGKYGFVSADAEFVNYSGASFNEDDDFSVFSNINSRISNTYKGSMNYRLGAEARFDIFRVRGGFAYYGDPYDASNYDRKRTYYTGGIGLKEKKFFIDAAYVHSNYNTVYSPYRLNDNSQPVVETEVTNGSFLITAGFNF